jgi:hypothetical protein
MHVGLAFASIRSWLLNDQGLLVATSTINGLKPTRRFPIYERLVGSSLRQNEIIISAATFLV